MSRDAETRKREGWKWPHSIFRVYDSSQEGETYGETVSVIPASWLETEAAQTALARSSADAALARAEKAEADLERFAERVAAKLNARAEDAKDARAGEFLPAWQAFEEAAQIVLRESVQGSEND